MDQILHYWYKISYLCTLKFSKQCQARALVIKMLALMITVDCEIFVVKFFADDLFQ